VTDPVRAVNDALVESGLAFSYSPYYEQLPRRALWFIQFDGEREIRLWLGDDEDALIVATIAPPDALERGARPRELGNGIWLSRVPNDEVAATITMPIADLSSLKERAYELLEATEVGARSTQGASREPRGPVKRGTSKAGTKKRASRR